MSHKRFSQQKTFILYAMSCIGIFLLFLPDISVAQGASTSTSGFQGTIMERANTIIALASWFWIIPAKLIGVLMSNSFVYGESFYLANVLFKFWQIIRTFALYGLGLYFVGYLLYMRFNPGEGTQEKMMGFIKNIILGGIAVSASRWLIATLVDFSIILTSAVAAIPSHVYEETRETKKNCFSSPKVIPIDENGRIDPNKLSNPNNWEPLEREDIKPQGDDLSGPLMFFGISALKFIEMSYLPDQPSQQATSSDPTLDTMRGVSKTVVIVIVKLIFALIIIATMIILLVINVIRIVYLWVWIALSPLIVLIKIFDLKFIPDSLKKHIDWKNMLGLIMQPVAVVAMLSIGFIFIIELTAIFGRCENPDAKSSLNVSLQDGEVKSVITDPTSPVGSETTLGASLSATGDLLGGITGEVIVTIFVMFLLRSLIKVGASFSELTKEYTKKVTDTIETVVGTTGFIPVPGGGKIGLKAAGEFLTSGLGMKDRFDKKFDKQKDLLREKLGIQDENDISETTLGDLTRTAEKTNTPLGTLKSAIADKIKNRYISAEKAKTLTKAWLKSSGNNLKNKNILSTLGLSGLTSIQEKDLEAIWTGVNKDNAYKLLNRLFTNTAENSPATDVTNNRSQYGGRDKT